MTRQHRLSGTFFTVLLGTLLLASGLGGILIDGGLRRRERQQLVETLRTQARLLQRMLVASPAVVADPAALQRTIEDWEAESHGRVTIVASDGRVLADSERRGAALAAMDNHANRPEIHAALHGEMGTGVRYSQTLHRPLLYVAIPFQAPPLAPGAIRLAVPAEELSLWHEPMRRMVLLALGLAFVTAWGLSYGLSRVIARPIQRIAEVARRITRGELDARAATGPGEIGALGEVINEMAAQLNRRLQDLESQRHQAQAILESLGEGVLALDARGIILWLNPAAQRLFQLEPAIATGKPLTALVRQVELERLIQDALEQRRPVVRELPAFLPEARAVQFHATPCEGGANGPRLVLVAQDVTEIRRLEGLRREFVANVSHELKTPLTSIKSLVETLLSGALDDPAHNRQFVAMLDEDATRLTRLIDDLLALSQLDSRAVPLRVEAVNVRRLLEDLAGRLAPLLRDHAVQLEVHLPSETPAVEGDAERLRQVFLNLLENAVKFNRSGGSVTVSAIAEGPTLRISVADTGLGIPETDLPRIFERFYRVDKARSRTLGGTGLGLAIVRHLVELHHGQVTVSSRLDQGSVFTVTLPIWSTPNTA